MHGLLPCSDLHHDSPELSQVLLRTFEQACGWRSGESLCLRTTRSVLCEVKPGPEVKVIPAVSFVGAYERVAELSVPFVQE